MAPTVFLTTRQVADELSLNPETIPDMIAAGDFPNAIHNGRTGNGRRYRIPRTDVTNYTKTHRVTAA